MSLDDHVGGARKKIPKVHFRLVQFSTSTCSSSVSVPTPASILPSASLTTASNTFGSPLCFLQIISKGHCTPWHCLPSKMSQVQFLVTWSFHCCVFGVISILSLMLCDSFYLFMDLHDFEFGCFVLFSLFWCVSTCSCDICVLCLYEINFNFSFFSIQYFCVELVEINFNVLFVSCFNSFFVMSLPTLISMFDMFSFYFLSGFAGLTL